MPPRRNENMVFTAVVSAIAAVAAIPIALVIALSGGGTTVALAALFALLPVGPLIGCYLWLDRYEPEPRSLLVSGLAWGAFVATLLALVLQGIGGLVAGFSDAQTAAIVAPVTEEGTKGLFLFLLLVWRRGELDGVLDGIVYAGMVGIGFAFTENILYLAAAYNGTGGMGPGGVEELGFTFLLRGVASPFAHPLFTAFTGIGVGLAIASRSGVVRIVAPVLGYACAVLAHALWNGSTLLAGGAGFFGVYFLVMVPAFVTLVALAVWARSREPRILASALADAAARGLLPYSDIPHIVDLRARRRARQFARQYGGEPGFHAMRAYQQAAIELGYLHHRFLRGTAPPDFSARGQVFVDRMLAVRPLIAFPGVPGGVLR
jgi:protease PrsW